MLTTAEKVVCPENSYTTCSTCKSIILQIYYLPFMTVSEMARTGRQTRSFTIIRRGSLFAGGFHYSLDACKISREAMLDAKHKKQGDVYRKGRWLKIYNE